MMTDRKNIAEQRVGDIKEVLVAATNAEFWELAQKKGIVVQEDIAKDARYVAFYRTKPTGAITHIAEVITTERNCLPREVYRGFPRLLRIERRKGALHLPVKVYRLGKLIRLANPIENSPGQRVPQVRSYKRVVELMAARQTKDVFGSRTPRSRG